MKTLQITAKISLLFIVLGFVLHEITNNCSIMKISNPILSTFNPIQAAWAILGMSVVVQVMPLHDDDAQQNKGAAGKTYQPHALVKHNGCCN